MRTLSITRKKKFVACLATMRVYIEDSEGTTDIGGVKCKFLGKLKNGETLTAEIGEEVLRVFVIADSLSKGYCKEYYPIPAGTDDVVLTGQNLFNPANGNAFRFDGVTDPEVLASRTKGNAKGAVLLVVAIVAGIIVGTLIALT